jgi:DUF1680 family protein
MGPPSRRELLKTLGAGTLGAAVRAAYPSAFAPGAGDPRASPFPLGDVRLLEGPFLDARDRDARYLLELEPDRLLHNFRVNAGLPPKAPVYGGWESEEPWVEIRCHGHTLGHYLSACALMYASTADDRFHRRVGIIVSGLKACQDASPNGLICAFPDGAAQLDNSVSGRPFVGVPWYTMHKIFAGLRDAHVFARNRDALPVMEQLGAWAWKATRPLSEAQFQRMLDREHGGMNEVLADLHAFTNDPKYLTLARQFSHRALLDPLSEERDTLDGLHANTQIPKVIGFQRLYELTGEPAYLGAATFFWRTVVETRSFATGGHGDREHFFPRAEFEKRLASAKTMETCCTHNMLRLTRMLFGGAPSAAFADYYERALYNAILASQDPQSGMMTYFQPTRPGYLKLFHTPIDSFWCCTGTGMENHAKYNDSIYFHADDTLYINLFIPSVLTWLDKSVIVTQATRFPEQDSSRLTFKTGLPPRLTLKIRRPSWCPEMTVSVNGRRWKDAAASSGYVTIERTWRDDDVVDIRLPMALTTDPLPGSNDIVALRYGPIVLAARLGSEGIAPGADIVRNERTTGDVLDAAVDVPVFEGRPRDLVAATRRAGRSGLDFHATARGGRVVAFAPCAAIAHERYNLYWKLVSRARPPA